MNSRTLRLLLLPFFLPLFAQAQETVTLMAYNLLNYEGLQADSATRNPYFRKIMQEVKPDLLVCEEIVVYSAIQGFVANVMNDSADIYSLGTFITGFDTNKALIYRNEKFTFVSNKAIKTDLRDINEFTVIHKASGDTLRIYAVHLKASSSASDEAQRALEVDSLRKRTNALPVGSDFVVCGDFNIYSTNETPYQKLLQNNTSDDGNVNDPLPITGSFNNSSNAKYHTQSPRVRSFGGGVTGGLDDRFDMILFSNAIMQAGGITYVTGSTVPFGNDGNHYNDSINRPPNTAVSMEIANALHQASDHIPIIAKLQFEVTGMNNMTSRQTAVSVFPNPFYEELQFSFSAVPSTDIDFLMTDIVGRKIMHQLFKASSMVKVHAPAISGGIYFYQLKMNGEMVQGRIIKQ